MVVELRRQWGVLVETPSTHFQHQPSVDRRVAQSDWTVCAWETNLHFPSHPGPLRPQHEDPWNQELLGGAKGGLVSSTELLTRRSLGAEPWPHTQRGAGHWQLWGQDTAVRS